MNYPTGFFKDPGHLAAFGFGSGCAPKAPGTFGTLAAIPFFLLFQDLGSYIYLGVVVLSFIVGVWLCDRASKALGVHDHGGIVWDEFVGFWIAMYAAPAGWIWIVWGFILFRAFDILKPPPIKWLDQKVHGGFGIMIDDVLAGLFAWFALQATVLVVY